MQINRFTDLSLRVLMYLSQQHEEAPITINEIAKQFNVPKNHLIKVVTRLNKLSWIIASRGRNGGLKLHAASNKLKLGDIVKELENKPSLINCGTPPCALMGKCQLKEILDKSLEHFYQAMNQYTLQDVMDHNMQATVIELHKKFAIA